MAVDLRQPSGIGAVHALFNRLGSWLGARRELSPEQVVAALYRGILEREPDFIGLRDKIELLRSDTMLEPVIRSFIGSPEFRSRMLATVVPPFPLPDLTRAKPEAYKQHIVDGSPTTIFAGRDDADIAWMADCIEKHRYYDRLGVWNPTIDHDKHITAAIVKGLGARSCFELGCFTGPVLSLLADAGIAVAGADVSHIAFTLAYPNVRDTMLFGDLLSLSIDRRFDVVLCMDVLEHLSPLRLDDYIGRLMQLIGENGYLYLNAPMLGRDPTFGVVGEPYLDEWHAVGDRSYWRHWPCDENGWPLHGHLVWASPGWWTTKFAAFGLVRDQPIEAAIHDRLSGFFDQAISRKSLFVLRRADHSPRSAAVAAAMHAALAALPEAAEA